MKLSQISKQIQGKKILEEIHFTLAKNEIIGLIGRNGSGKTTLFRTISGQYLPDTGEINKTMAIRYLAPEILQLRLLGYKLDEIRALLEEEQLSVSLPHLLKTLRPSSLLVEENGHG